MNEQKLIFVYNANGDLLSTLSDFAHKILSPSTYQCQLCALTYGSFSVKREWKLFVQNLPMQTVFLHKNEFEKEYKSNVPSPAVFVQFDGTIKEIITKQEIESSQSLAALKSLITQKLQADVQHYHSHL